MPFTYQTGRDDFDNSYTVQATSDPGRIYAFHKTFETPGEAEELVDRMQNLSRNLEGPGLDPDSSDLWFYVRTIYGADAWGPAEELADHIADVEAEYGPGSYGPRNPGYRGW